MFKRRDKPRGRGAQKIPLKGLFSNGIWHCNCDPRLPAQHFQTKNGGKNHGRWFYTCQLPQPKRCDFFLWDDAAKPREAAAVLNNSRSEPGAAPWTPGRNSADGAAAMGPQTPKSLEGVKQWSYGVETPYTPSKPPAQAPPQSSTEEDQESYDWPLSDDEELFKVADTLSSNLMPPPETPRKAAKTDMLSTPGKRKRDDGDGGAALPTAFSGDNDDVFTTPSTNPRRSTSLFPPIPGLLSPADTPTPRRFKDVPIRATSPGQDSDLATEILQTLQPIPLIPSEIRDKVMTICNKHVMFTHGVIKGRDISRKLIASKNERITELQREIEGLKAERETGRAVVRHLRREAGGRGEGGGDGWIGGRGKGEISETKNT